MSSLWKCCAAVLFMAPLAGQAPRPESTTSLTIYNQNFAVARTTLDLDLKPGSNEITTTQVTRQVEPDSVVLRDPAGKHDFAIMEQNYDAAVVTQEWLLEKYEGKTIDFQSTESVDGQLKVAHTPGKILRASPPLIEVNGTMAFQLPGTPHFPASTDGLLLKPTLRWQITADKAAHFPAELSYITNGFSWSATYNLVAGAGDVGTTGSEPMDLVGWVTMQNECGVDFPAARIQLMAGDVARIQPPVNGRSYGAIGGMLGGVAKDAITVTQQNLDDFHLYDLNRTTALRNGETKQVAFIESAHLPVTRTYEFDGAQQRFQAGRGVVIAPTYGLDSAARVTITNTFVNSLANHLGVPLPAGRMRLYRRDKSGATQFAGEAEIVHTPRNEKVRFVSGGAFDITGKRRQTNFHVDTAHNQAEESFEIEIQNHKDQPIELNVVEHLYRAANWEIAAHSHAFSKSDADTIEFPVQVKPEGTATVSYTVHYSW